VWLVAVAVGVWLVAGYFAATGPRSLLAKDPAASSAEPAEDGPGPGTAPPVTAGPRATPKVDPSATESAAPARQAPAAPEDVGACVVGLFAPETFRKRPNFDFLCTQRNPRKGGTAVRARVVGGAGGKVTGGMREWAGLGWYEAAAYAVLQARCCGSAPPLEWSFDLVCPVDGSVDSLQKAVRGRDERAAAAAVRDYSKQVRCISKFGQASNFGQSGSPGPGISLLERFLERALGTDAKTKD